MKRREFIAGLGSAAAWPVVAHAQQATMPVIGYLGTTSPEAQAQRLALFRRGLSETGYIEGKNVAIEYRWGGGQRDRYRPLADDLVRRKVDLIVADGGALGAIAVKAATATIPILFAIGGDPVRVGLVVSLSRPEGNLTGIQISRPRWRQSNSGCCAKWCPSPKRSACSWTLLRQMLSARSAACSQSRALSELSLQWPGPAPNMRSTWVSPCLSNNELTRSISVLAHSFSSHATQIIAIADRYRVPVIYTGRRAVDAGGLASYSANTDNEQRQLGTYAGRILKGEKPADLPVLRPTKFEFVINLKTAKALGLTIPETLLATADEVIQ
jgi:putative tryptophan/tyrosine transport system substrate-binding protein